MIKAITRPSFVLKRLSDNDTLSSLTIMSMRFGMLAAKFILSIFMVRYMGLKELGVYGLIVGASGIIQAVLRGGVFLIICRDAVHQSRFELMHDLRHYVSGVLALYLILSPVAFVAGEFWGVPVIAILALCVFLTEHLAFDAYVLINNLQYPKLANFIYSLQSAVWIYLFVICAFFYEPFRSLETLLAFWTSGGLIALAIVVWLSRDWPWKKVCAAKWDAGWYVKKIRRSAKLYFADVLGVMNYYLDRYIVSLFLSLEITGIYVFFSQVMTATWNLINSGVLAVYAPHLIRAYDEKNTKPFNSLYRWCLKRTYLATFGLALLAGTVVPYIVSFTGDKTLLDHITLLWIMLLALLFKIGGTCAGAGLFAMHKDRERFITEIVTFFITAFIGSAAVMAFGVYGAVLNTVVGSTVSVFYAWLVWKNSNKGVQTKGVLANEKQGQGNGDSDFLACREKNIERIGTGHHNDYRHDYRHNHDPHNGGRGQNKPKNILIISSLFPPYIFGGAEIASYNRARLLAKRGYNVSVLTLCEKETPPAWGEMTSEGFKLYRIKTPRHYTLFERTKQMSQMRKFFWHLQDYFDRRNGRRVGDVLDDVKPDHVEIDNLIGIGFNALSEIGRRNVSVAYILHDLNLACFRTCMFRKGRVCQRQCTSCSVVAVLRQVPLKKISRLGFISPSRANLQHAERFVPVINQSPSCVIRNVPEAVSSYPKQKGGDELRILFVGRLDVVKGIEFLFYVLEPLSRLYQFHLTILGTGPCEPQLRKKYEGKAWVTFRGFVPASEVTKALLEHDLYCIPSLIPESYGLVTAQALQLGVPVIGSNIGGTAELVRSDVTGLLLPPGDNRAWTAAFSKVFLNKDIVTLWSENACALAHEFDENTIGQAHEDFIGKLYTQSERKK